MTSRPRLLDLFCGAGGSAKGYADAGFEVVGVDNVPQKNYPYEFHQADALTFPLDGFDVIHASPPCQLWTVARYIRKNSHSDFIAPMKQRLKESGKPYIIENVPHAPLPGSIILCGTMFGLKVFRHRLFESNFLLFSPDHCRHTDSVKGGNMVSVFGNGDWRKNYDRERGSLAMGIDWMTLKELSQAIPPAYTKYIGEQLIQYVQTALEVSA